MKIRALFITSVNRGDHAADVYKVFDVNDNETVENLVNRCGLSFDEDVIEIKLVKDT